MSRPIRPTPPDEAKRRRKQKAATDKTVNPATSADAPVTETSAPTTHPDADLTAWITERRWFARGDDDQPLQRQTSVDLATAPSVTVDVVGFGPDQQYQLLRWTAGPTGGGADPSTTARFADPDVADDPVAAGALARFVAASDSVTAADGSTVQATWLADAAPPGDFSARPLGGEQSNTSVVIGGTHVLKLFRRVRPGIHPEVEMARHLASVGSDALPVADLAGWWELTGADGSTTALGVVQTFVAGALDGWSLVLSALAGDPDGLLPRLHVLGRSLADLHAALAEPASAPASPGAAEAATGDDLSTFGARPFPADLADTVVHGLLAAAVALRLDAEMLAAVETKARSVAGTVTGAAVGGTAGAAIRHHGDLHLGQVVWADQGWVVLDFEGEPGRPLQQRRARHSPLRDVAGMLRSLSYAVATHHQSGGNGLSDGWEPAARAAFLDGYLRQVPPALLPASPLTTHALIGLLELEKVVYEIGYEQAHRPDWVDIPLGHLRHFVEEQP